MKKVVFVFISAIMLQGCKTSDIKGVASDAVSGAISGVLKSSDNIGGIIPVGKSKSYSVGSENISTVKAVKTNKDYGIIQIVKTQKNPKGQTKLALDSCSHPRIGKLRCGGYIFEMTKEGWLKNDPITFDDLNNPEITIAAGDYYLKFDNWNSGGNRFATGKFTVKPFVTNIVSIELE